MHFIFTQKERTTKIMSVKITVIVPVYNAEKTLKESLDSIFGQSFIQSTEVILIDDGSTDGSAEIIEEYKQQFDNLVFIKQTNSGPSAARNRGLDAAHGEYVYFMDADDLLESGALEFMYAAAAPTGADMVLAKYDIFNKYTFAPVKNLDNIVLQKYIHKFDPALLWTFSLWNKLFSRSVIEKNQLRFPIDTSYSEDGVFTMSFIYCANTITGYDGIVYHYRKANTGVNDSITATITEKKVSDYILSHNLILKSAANAFLKEYPEYETFEQAVKENASINFYVNEFFRKEISILYNQFYKKFWSLDENTIKRLVDEIQNINKKINLRRYNQILNSYYELPLSLYRTHSEALGSFSVTAVLFGGADNDDGDFIDCLLSLCGQDFVPLRIVLPESARELVESRGIFAANIFYIDADDTNSLFKKSLEAAQTPYMLFCHKKLRYNINAVTKMFKFLNKSHFDFITNLIHIEKAGEFVPVDLQRKAFDYYCHGYAYKDDALFDSIYANKLFKTEFLNKIKFGEFPSISEALEAAYTHGYYKADTKCNIVYADYEIRFAKDLLKHSADKFIRSYVFDEPITLESKSIQNNVKDVSQKLLFNPKKKTLKGRFAKLVMKLIRKLSVKDRVFFLNIRKDDELEGNAKALEPYIKGKKIICSKRLPHGSFYKLKMYYYTFTSKVIICDDYNRYLRVFPLKPEQRVIQLWHACGAFKKFGLNGTTLSKKIDLATHVQYNVVCTSSEFIRPIYAQSFGISPAKVKALGSPRTDKFFDQNYIKKTSDKIYSARPEFRGKEIILYAPTFRDKVPGRDRSCFIPELDFNKLSKALSGNQIFIICPHPLMKNKIVEKKFKNIFVVRDFSTNDMMLISDVMITDYSSVIFEYALLKKPIAFFCYDLNKYDRGFYLDYKSDLPGSLLTNQAELFSFLQSPDHLQTGANFNLFCEKYMSACDGKSCERIAKLINDYIG